MTNNKDNKAYIRAKERVEKEKGFYSHLTAYIIINIALLLINIDFGDVSMNSWLHWNQFITPVFWGIGLLIHGIYVFGKLPSLGKDWEERKIKELMDKDDF